MKVSVIKAVVFALVFGLSQAQLYSQNTESDRMLTQKTSNFLERMQNCYDSSHYILASNPLKSKLLALEGLQIAKKNKNSEMQARFHRIIGASYTMLGNYDSSGYYLEKAKNMSATLSDKYFDALVDLSLGTLYVRQMKYDDAMAGFMTAVEYFEMNGDKQNLIKTYGNIAALFMYQHNYEQAEKYYSKVEKISAEINNHSGLGQAYSGLSSIYRGKGIIDTALTFALKSAEEFNRAGEKAFESVAYKEAASIYLMANDLENAREMAGKSCTVATETGLTRYVANALLAIAEISFHSKNFNESIDKSLVSLTTDSTDSETKAANFVNLMKCYLSIGQPEIAIGYFNRYKKELDKQLTDKNREAISEMEVKYETEKKELQIKALEERKKMYLTAGISAFLLMLLLVVVLIYREKIIIARKKIAEQKVIQLEKEKQLIATQSLLAGEEIERTRLAGDLHDGLGGLLTGVKLKLSSMKENSIITSENLAHFNHALDLLDTSIAEMRRVAHNLMPETLMHYGLQTAISDFVRQVEPDDLPVIQFSIFGSDLRYSKELEITVYRIVQELVNNALKHARAKKIDVQLFTETNRVSVQIVDDGIGYDTEHAGKQIHGKGLRNISDRITAFNGHFEILSEPGKGTECTLEFLIT